MTARPSPFTAVLRALRVHQWVKNLLVFVPAALAHRFDDPALWGRAGLTFLAFGLVASCGYVINDLLDRDADRRHARKRLRPFAAGELSLGAGVGLAAGAGALGLALGVATLPRSVVAVLGLYLVGSVAYSARLKRYPLIDVLVLAGLYTVRLVAGAAAAAVVLSHWLATFALFVFLSLAFVKRYAELAPTVAASAVASGRGYHRGDLDMLRILGSVSGYLSILVLALYINSDAVVPLYHRPALLWLVLPVLLYWISRLWLRAHRGELRGDPLVETAADPASYWVAAVVLAVLVGASV